MEKGDVASILETGKACEELGMYKKAAAIYKNALLKTRMLSQSKELQANILSRISKVQMILGDYIEAEENAINALEYSRNTKFSNPIYAITLGTLAKIYIDTNKYTIAHEKAKESIRIFEGQQLNTEGLYYDNYILSINYLALSLLGQEKFSESEKSFLQTLNLCKDKNGYDYAVYLNNCANLYYVIHRYDEAVEMYEHALEILDMLSINDTFDYAVICSNCGRICNIKKEYNDAEKYLLKCKAILKKQNLEKSIEYIAATEELAKTHYNIGKKTEFYFNGEIAVYKQIKIMGSDSKGFADRAYLLAYSLFEKGKLRLAKFFLMSCVDMLEKNLEINSISLAKSYTLMANIYYKQKKKELAIQKCLAAAEICNDFLKKLFFEISRESFLSIRKLLLNTYELLLSIIPSNTEDNIIYKKCVLSIVHRKTGELYSSRFRDNIVEEYCNEDEYRKLKFIKENINSIIKTGSKEGTTCLIELKNAYYLLESEIIKRARKDAGFEGKLVPPGFYQEYEIVLDYCWYKNYTSDDRTPKYCVIAYKPGQEKDGDIIFLGDAEDIDSTIKDLRDKLLYENEEQEKKDHKGKEISRKNKELKDAEDCLYSLIYKPLLEKVPGLKDASRITICADGELTKLPFELIIPDKQIRYLTSGTDGEWIGLSQTKNSDDIVSGNPVVGEAQGPYKDNNNNSRAGFPMKDLAYSGMECERIEKLLNARAKGEDKYLVQADFRKEKVMKISRPRIWHISTHGFFYENEERGNWLETQNLHPFEQKLMRIQDPYRRCGLALFRANRAMEGPEEAEKVLLTGRDILELDLTGTDLAALSACDTGIGEICVGTWEGVYGLQRSFMLSGCKTLIMSLFKCDDFATTILMVKMYEGILEGRRIDESLQEAKRYVRESTREEFKKDNWIVDANKDSAKPYEAPYYWAGFICLGDGGKVNIH